MNAIIQCRQIVSDIYATYDASHDLDHIDRVMLNAEEILATEPTADPFLVRMAVLLHDIDDPKYSTGGENRTEKILQELKLPPMQNEQILSIIDAVSFRGGNETDVSSIEAAIVRDADRLDAIGAIGIARAFAYGGAKGRKLYDQNEMIRTSMSEKEYRGKQTASITHFYEKLLLLKDRMTTREGKRLAKERHDFMVSYLTQLEKEVGRIIHT